MNKIGAISIMTIAVVIVYLIMLVVIPFLSDVASTTNTTIGATATGNYEATQNFMMAIPWILWFVPGTIYMIILVVILRQP